MCSMAFTGDPVVALVSDGLVRITGVSLDSEASGTIGLADATGIAPDITLPDDFAPRPYRTPPVTLQDSIQVDVLPAASPVTVEKTGFLVTDFRVTISNVASGGGSSNPAPDIDGDATADASIGGD